MIAFPAGTRVWIAGGITDMRCGVESLQEFLADVRTWNGGIRDFLRDEQGDPDVIERIMAAEKNR